MSHFQGSEMRATTPDDYTKLQISEYMRRLILISYVGYIGNLVK